MKSNQLKRFCALATGGLCLTVTLAIIGTRRSHQVEPLPSPWYIGENIQYFPPTPDFKLSREAAAMKAYKADLEAQRAGQ